MNSVERRNEQIAEREKLSAYIDSRESEVPSLPDSTKPAARAFIKALREEEGRQIMAIYASWEMLEEKL
jgi:hypothetical protein